TASERSLFCNLAGGTRRCQGQRRRLRHLPVVGPARNGPFRTVRLGHVARRLLSSYRGGDRGLFQAEGKSWPRLGRRPKRPVNAPHTGIARWREPAAAADAWASPYSEFSVVPAPCAAELGCSRTEAS